ncbi:MotA/TolQ/ExbB proton channel family protein [Falsiruegeria mediterranea]|uniref:Biopolymer transport protein ExbB n=1 Tax=Falsiruegeria mediterranea M17 TaxID=1200281 RepID=A0A2R8CE46_9RHOB|nr:MotA/TolQ/ExbB proton channel family protein [Falsiruegeria mediterranea]SPJ30694.1 Biopolymer transport protein ExbB [Falsiruegeria mediterranea M17]
MERIEQALIGVLELGGPVVVALLLTSVVTAALVLYKLWQYRAAGVGRHIELSHALDAWDRGDETLALRHLAKSRSYLAPVIEMAVDGGPGELSERTDAEAEERFSQLERGLSALDMVAQLAPLLGLFGTVLGMIEAFQKLQSAGSSVDPSLLAGGIWVALLTTAAGLAVAMPTSLILTWFEARMHRERVFANRALRTVFAPGQKVLREASPVMQSVAHGA